MQQKRLLVIFRCNCCHDVLDEFGRTVDFLLRCTSWHQWKVSVQYLWWNWLTGLCSGYCTVWQDGTKVCCQMSLSHPFNSPSSIKGLIFHSVHINKWKWSVCKCRRDLMEGMISRIYQFWQCLSILIAMRSGKRLWVCNLSSLSSSSQQIKFALKMLQCLIAHVAAQSSSFCHCGIYFLAGSNQRVSPFILAIDPVRAEAVTAHTSQWPECSLNLAKLRILDFHVQICGAGRLPLYKY